MLKQKIITGLTGLLIVLVILWLMISRQDTETTLKGSYFYLGTLIEITLYDTDDQALLKDLEATISFYDQLLDRNKADSDISRLNQSKYSQVHPHTYDLISQAYSYSQVTQGYFDITINPLVDLWAINTPDEQVPSNQAIQEVLDHVDYREIELLDDNYIRLGDHTSLDLGGIAKGFIADKLHDQLKEMGLSRALINLGGNIYAYGNSPNDTAWNIGIKHPGPEGLGPILKLMLTDRSIVTSGVTERFFEQDGIRYHHILNPFDGYPINNDILSVTIISDQSIDGDALATGMFALGRQAAFEKLREFEDIEMIIITSSQGIYYSVSLENRLVLFDQAYQLIPVE